MSQSEQAQQSVYDYIERRTTDRFDSVGIDTLFTNLDLTDTKSNVYQFANVDGNTTTIAFEKFGFEANDESDIDNVDQMIEMMMASMAQQAADEIQDVTADPDWVWGSSPETLLDDAYEHALASFHGRYDPDTVLVGRALLSQIRRDTGLIFDELQASIGDDDTEVGLAYDEFNLLGGGNVYVADTDKLGYRGIREGPTMKRYTEYANWDPRYDGEGIEPPEDAEVLQHVNRVHARAGYTIADPDAIDVVHVH